MSVDPSTCKHAKHMPTFDLEGAKALLAACAHARSANPLDLMFGICTECTNAIRARWPRFSGACSECGENLIMYASMEHYGYGDW